MFNSIKPSVRPSSEVERSSLTDAEVLVAALLPQAGQEPLLGAAPRARARDVARLHPGANQLGQLQLADTLQDLGTREGSEGQRERTDDERSL